MSGKREIRKPVTEEDVRKWEQAWTEMMVTIWKENILRLGIVDTMALYKSFQHRIADTGAQVQIAHEFLLYGIYAAKGVGRGYTHDNGGDLAILDKSYRKAYGLDRKRLRSSSAEGKMTSGKPRKRRDWFTPRYLSSIDVLTRVETELYGNAYMGTLSNVLGAMFDKVTVEGSNGRVVTDTLSRW